MKASCETCFWAGYDESCDQHEIWCRHVENGSGQMLDTSVCSNWQAKDTKAMKCVDCRYSIEVHTTKEEWHFDGVREIQPDEVSGCLNNTNEFYWSNNAGCTKFWPKDGE